jgi:hypothetical protein
MLTTLQIKTAKPGERAYKVADSGGLFLLVQPNGSKLWQLWRYKFRLSGVERLHALGAFPDMGLADAREAHAKARKLVARGINPVRARREKRDEQARHELRMTNDRSAPCARTGLPRPAPRCGRPRSRNAIAKSRRT